MRVELLGVMFPERAEHIERAWSSICSATTDDEQRWTRMSDWAEAEIGAEFATLRSEIAQSNELEVSWELKQILDERLKAMDYPRLTAKVSLWWAARSTNAIQRSAVERSMAEAIGLSVSNRCGCWIPGTTRSSTTLSLCRASGPPWSVPGVDLRSVPFKARLQAGSLFLYRNHLVSCRQASSAMGRVG